MTSVSGSVVRSTTLNALRVAVSPAVLRGPATEALPWLRVEQTETGEILLIKG